ncbi:rhodanese-like domain-containing protein [Nonomuraea sp. K274]|uniref:Rhodanese-like domain-containing protein n=1 Tax=Nonomuraea cypriaca TaxID=1187855 RepID=A0A931AIZ1_9ACTN|nr:rhodanese-like domain-containing protein [Nonomuraea cypriaca]MBF8191859.1 rhodanese-like domain-containing protein [Nonomuraea cypriaca]
MTNIIDREAVQDLLATRQAQLVEVLPEAEYAWAHLPLAVNVPLAAIDRSAGEFDRSRPVIVYCHDWLCDLSPRAAHRLDRLGFPEVHDYAVGKMDWLSADLPYDGEAALVSQHVRRDPVTAVLDEPLDELAERIIADPAGLAVVVDADDVVQGVIGSRELKGADMSGTAEQAMRVGPTTVRPSEQLEPLIQRMDRAKVNHIVVTQVDGGLVGLFGLGDVRAQESESDLG